MVNPNPDAVAEFRVLESTYGAEYGRNAGGIVSIVSKSGTNQLHGTAYDYVRNTDFDANDFFIQPAGPAPSGPEAQPVRRHVRRPHVIPHIVDGRNKLFFFFSYQGQKQTQVVGRRGADLHAGRGAGNFSQAVNGGPDPNVVAFLQANPVLSAQPHAGQPGHHQTRSSIDPVAQAYFKYGLIPTSPTGFLFPTASAIDNDNEYLGKLDYAISSRDTVSGTFTAHDDETTNPFSNADVNGYTSANFPPDLFRQASITLISSRPLF